MGRSERVGGGAWVTSCPSCARRCSASPAAARSEAQLPEVHRLFEQQATDPLAVAKICAILGAPKAAWRSPTATRASSASPGRAEAHLGEPPRSTRPRSGSRSHCAGACRGGRHAGLRCASPGVRPARRGPPQATPPAARKLEAARHRSEVVQPALGGPHRRVRSRAHRAPRAHGDHAPRAGALSRHRDRGAPCRASVEQPVARRTESPRHRDPDQRA